jgi:hypothetical protein
MDVTPQAGRYRVIYADPPWRFATHSDKGKGRSAEAHYDCLSMEHLTRRPKRVKSGCGLRPAQVQYIVVTGWEWP